LMRPDAENRDDLDEQLLCALRERPCTRSELRAQLRVPRTTLYDHLVHLMRQGLVARRTMRRGQRGRPPVQFYLTTGGGRAA